VVKEFTPFSETPGQLTAFIPRKVPLCYGNTTPLPPTATTMVRDYSLEFLHKNDNMQSCQAAYTMWREQR
jgi:hypothetical protein